MGGILGWDKEVKQSSAFNLGLQVLGYFAQAVEHLVAPTHCCGCCTRGRSLIYCWVTGVGTAGGHIQMTVTMTTAVQYSVMAPK